MLTQFGSLLEWCATALSLVSVACVVLLATILLVRIVLEANPRTIRTILALLYCSALFYQFIWVWNPAELFGAVERALLAEGDDVTIAQYDARMAVSDYFWGVVLTFVGAFAAAADLAAQGIADRYLRIVARVSAVAVPAASALLAACWLTGELEFNLLPGSWLPTVATILLPLLIAWLPKHRLRVFGVN